MYESLIEMARISELDGPPQKGVMLVAGVLALQYGHTTGMRPVRWEEEPDDKVLRRTRDEGQHTTLMFGYDTVQWAAHKDESNVVRVAYREGSGPWSLFTVE